MFNPYRFRHYTSEKNPMYTTISTTISANEIATINVITDFNLFVLKNFVTHYKAQPIWLTFVSIVSQFYK